MFRRLPRLAAAWLVCCLILWASQPASAAPSKDVPVLTSETMETPALSLHDGLQQRLALLAIELEGMALGRPLGGGADWAGQARRGPAPGNGDGLPAGAADVPPPRDHQTTGLPATETP